MMQAKDEEKKIEFAKFINDHSLQLIGLIDTKTTIIVAINGIILGLLFQSEVLREVAHQNDEIRVLFQLVVGLLGASAIFGLVTIFPRIQKNTALWYSMKLSPKN
jgi:hypothetical protein